MTRASHLTAAHLVLQPAARAGARWVRWSAVGLLCLVAGAAAGFAVARHAPWVTAEVDAGLARQHDLQQQVDKARMAAQVSAARMTALEQQIDQLSRQGAECQEQLAFFRKAQSTKAH